MNDFEKQAREILNKELKHKDGNDLESDLVDALSTALKRAHEDGKKEKMTQLEAHLSMTRGSGTEIPSLQTIAASQIVVAESRQPTWPSEEERRAMIEEIIAAVDGLATSGPSMRTSFHIYELWLRNRMSKPVETNKKENGC